MIITIDGPAGSGKSTAARTLAVRLGFDYLDTGAMYRAIALALLQQGFDLENLPPHLPLDHIQIDMRPPLVFLNGVDVTQAIRSAEVTAGSSKVATHAEVRQFLVEQQRKIAQGRNIICEGRDQGTVVFPRAERKFFLTATPEARARRRLSDLLARGEKTDLETVLRIQEERDRRDASRHLSPLRPAEDAVVIDTTPLTLAEVIDRLERDIRG